MTKPLNQERLAEALRRLCERRGIAINANPNACQIALLRRVTPVRHGWQNVLFREVNGG